MLIHQKNQPLLLNYSGVLFLMRKSSNNRFLISQCFCCQKQQILGRNLHLVSRILGYNINFCEKCKYSCDHRRSKCVITKKIKAINLVNAVITKKNRLPMNMYMKMKFPALH